MESKGSPVRTVRVIKEPVGAQNQRKLNYVPKDPELLKKKDAMVI